MSRSPNGSRDQDSRDESLERDRGRARFRGRSEEEGVALDVALPSQSGAGRSRQPRDENTLRIELPKSAEGADLAAVEAAVARGLKQLRESALLENRGGADNGHEGRAGAGGASRDRLSERSRRGEGLGSREGGGGGEERQGPPPNHRRRRDYDEEPEEEFLPDEAPRIGRELSLRDIFFMVRERWILGLAVGLLLAGGLAYWMMSKPPVFESEVELLVDFKKSKILPIESLEEEGPGMTNLEQVVEVHARSLQSPAFRKFVETRLSKGDEGGAGESLLRGFRDFAAFKKAYTDGLIQLKLRGKKATPEAVSELPEPEELFVEHFFKQENGPFDVSSSRRSQFISLTFRHPDPQVAGQVAHAFVESYSDFLGERERASHTYAREHLQGEVRDLEAEVVKQEKVISLFRQEHEIMETEEGEGSRESDRVDSLAQTVTASEVELNGLKIQLRNIEQVDSEDVVRLSQFPVIAEYSMVASMKERLDKNEEEHTQLDRRFLRRHPKIIENTAVRNTLISQLQAEVAGAIEEFRNRVKQKGEEHEELVAELRAASLATLGDNDPMVDYRVMKGKLDILKSKHEALLGRLSEVQLAERLDRTNIEVTTPAVVPEFPVDPNPKKVLALAGVLFLGSLFGLPVGLGFLDTRLKSFSEAESFLGMECLGCVPERPKLGHMELGQCVLAERDEQIIEGFKVIFGSVELHSQAGFPKILVITSTGPGEGKSFAAANLAATFARHGGRALIIDCDFRRPAQHKLIGAKNDAGLLKWLKQGTHLPRTAKELVDDPALGLVPLSEEHDLFLLRAGGSTRSPSEIISSQAFDDLLQNLRHWFDIIMLDSPPVGLFQDAIFLANYAEESLFVCRHNGLNRHKIKFALRKMQDGNAKVLGTIMNQLSVSRRHQYGYGYRDYGYSSYGHKDYAKYYSNEKEED